MEHGFYKLYRYDGCMVYRVRVFTHLKTYGI